MLKIQYVATIRGRKTVLRTTPYEEARWNVVQNNCITLEAERGLPAKSVRAELVTEDTRSK